MQKQAWALILLLCLSSSLNAQIPGFSSDNKVAAPGTNVFDTVTNKVPLVISNIAIQGNNVTKSQIITRELSFKVADTIPVGELKNHLIVSRQNLQNTSLFNFVNLFYAINGNELEIKVFLIERWYTWPSPLFELAEPNFNTWWLDKDFSRTFYGMYLTKENFRGLKETVKVKVQFGYSQQFALLYHIPYINKKQTIGLGITTSFSRNKEIAYATIGNKRVFYESLNDFVREEFYTRMLLSIRNNIYNTNTFQLNYSFASIDKEIIQISDDYFTNNSNEINYMILGYEFRQDKRDVKSYPLRGHYFEVEGVKVGVGLLENEPDIAYLLASYRKYWKLSPRWYYAFGTKMKYSIYGEQPYFLQKGLGYGSDGVRSYEYYVIDGQNWILGKTHLKYQLVSPKVARLNFIGNEKVNTFHYAFYLNLFADAGYVDDKYYSKLNPLSNELLLGYGIGIDYVTYYDKTLRFEYSFNRHAQNGFFINALVPF